MKRRATVHAILTLAFPTPRVLAQPTRTVYRIGILTGEAPIGRFAGRASDQFEMVISLKTAGVPGLTISPSRNSSSCHRLC